MNENTPPDDIPLSPAQNEHLTKLFAARNQAEQMLQQFMAYLYAEHNVSPDDYPTVDAKLGLVAKQSKT